MSKKLTTEERHRVRGALKQKAFDSMTYGRKSASSKAREWFRRPAYSSRFESGGEKDAD